LKLALKPDWLGHDQEVTRAFLELAMSKVGKADWSWFSKQFSSLPELRRFKVVEALGQYRSQHPETPEADVKQLARALTEIQLTAIKEQMIQGDNPETPAIFRIKSLESVTGDSHDFMLENDQGNKLRLKAGSLLPVTEQAPSLRPDPQQMLLTGSHSERFPGSFLDTRHSSRFYRQAMQDGQLAPDRYRNDVERFVKIFSDLEPESYRQEFQQKRSLDLSAGRPVHWQLNPRHPLQASRLLVGDKAITVELGMKDTPPLSHEFFDKTLGQLYALSLAKSIEPVDAALFRSGWPEQAGQLGQLGDSVGFDPAYQWVPLTAALSRDTLEHHFGSIRSPTSQEDVRKAMIWLFTQPPELLSLSLEKLFENILPHQDDPSVEAFARALREFDQNLPDDGRARFREAFTHQQVELLKDVLSRQIPDQPELVNYIGSLKTTPS
ncbi:hypothetical protein, partial [Endozoicomonas sp. SESOKO3]|uniref:hypothetical protein n=1 Tax=Endozoicomonas sp. SESOKO3 TaxID=2828744 RepID=UPI0021482BEE